MKSRKKPFLLAGICLLLLLSGCADTGQTGGQDTRTEGLEKLGSILVISREEGSGTRNAFAELSGFLENTEGKPDLTTERAQIAESTEAVLEMVGENESAIGYLSLGALPESESIKTIKVNGAEADLKEKSYPLSRNFYLAYSGTLSELEQDFLTYVHGAGQALVEESYIPVAKSSTFLSNKEKGTITISGSTSVAPLMEKLAEAYMKINPNAEIIVEATDSTDGLTRAMSGEVNLGMASRELKDYESELLDYEAIARDNIAVIVNAKNPLENITLDSLKNIFTGEFEKWEDLNQ